MPCFSILLHSAPVCLLGRILSIMDEELFELAKDNDLTHSEAQEVQDLADELGVDVDDALEIWQEQ